MCEVWVCVRCVYVTQAQHWSGKGKTKNKLHLTMVCRSIPLWFLMERTTSSGRTGSRNSTFVRAVSRRMNTPVLPAPALGRRRGALVRGRGALVRGSGALVRGRGALVRGRGALVRGGGGEHWWW